MEARCEASLLILFARQPHVPVRWRCCTDYNIPLEAHPKLVEADLEVKTQEATAREAELEVPGARFHSFLCSQGNRLLLCVDIAAWIILYTPRSI